MEYLGEKMSSSDAQPIKLHLLKTVTQDFSEKFKIGSGGSGVVYKAVLNGDEIAVKMLFPVAGLDNEAFEKEFRRLGRFLHKNLMRMIGYCYEIAHRDVEYQGKLVWSQVIDRALCFEFMKGGSLAKHISAESCIHDWPTTYKIINGICEGLHYLHYGGEQMTFHLNLKLENVLLDEQLVPKIGDIGLSRLLNSRRILRRGPFEFMPHEYMNNNKKTPKTDVFSLGVIIFHLMAGARGYNDYLDCQSPGDYTKFIGSVQDYWKTKMHASKRYKCGDLLGVTTCIEMAMRCVEDDQEKRPSINEIRGQLKELDTKMDEMLKEDPKAPLRQLCYQALAEASSMHAKEPRAMTFEELQHNRWFL